MRPLLLFPALLLLAACSTLTAANDRVRASEGAEERLPGTWVVVGDKERSHVPGGSGPLLSVYDFQADGTVETTTVFGAAHAPAGEELEFRDFRTFDPAYTTRNGRLTIEWKNDPETLGFDVETGEGRDVLRLSWEERGQPPLLLNGYRLDKTPAALKGEMVQVAHWTEAVAQTYRAAGAQSGAAAHSPCPEVGGLPAGYRVTGCTAFQDRAMIATRFNGSRPERDPQPDQAGPGIVVHGEGPDYPWYAELHHGDEGQRSFIFSLLFEGGGAARMQELHGWAEEWAARN